MQPLGIAAGFAVLALLLVGAYLLERRRREVEARQLELLARQETLLARLGPSVAGEFRAELEAHLVPVLDGMVAALDRLTTEVELRQRDALREMATSFTVHLTANVRDEFDALGRALHDAAAWHEKVHRDLGVIIEDGQRLSEGHVAMLRRTLKVSEAVRGNAESLSRAERSLELTADRVQASATAITKSLETGSASMVDRLREATTEISEHLTELTANLNEQMDRSEEQFGKRLQGMTLTLERVASNIDTLSRSQQAHPGGPFRRGF